MAEERKGLFAKMRGMRERAAKNSMPPVGVDTSRGLTPDQAEAMSEGKPLPKRTPPKKTPSDPDIAGMAAMKVEAEPFRMEGEAPTKAKVTGVDRDKAMAQPAPAPKPTSPVQYKPMEGGKIRFSPAVDPYVYEYDPQTKAYTIVEGPQGVGAIFGPDHPAAAKFEASRAEALQQSGSEMVPRRLQEARAIREAKEAEAEALQQSGAEAPATAEAPAAPAPEGEAAATVDDELMDTLGITEDEARESIAKVTGVPPRGATGTIDSPASIDNPELPRGYTDPEGNFHRLYARGQRDTAAVFERGQAADEYTERTQALMENQGEMSRLQRMLVDEVKADMQRNAPPGTAITDEEVLALLEKNAMRGPTREEDEEADMLAMRRMLGV